jgi:hypothetical protein
MSHKVLHKIEVGWGSNFELACSKLALPTPKLAPSHKANNLVGPELVKYLSSSNDLELYWSYAEIIFSFGFAVH